VILKQTSVGGKENGTWINPDAVLLLRFFFRAHLPLSGMALPGAMYL